jgi:hypothetical protein
MIQEYRKEITRHAIPRPTRPDHTATATATATSPNDLMYSPLFGTIRDAHTPTNQSGQQQQQQNGRSNVLIH